MNTKAERQWVSFEASSVALFTALTLSLAVGAAARQSSGAPTSARPGWTQGVASQASAPTVFTLGAGTTRQSAPR